jgi:hypothetical protein
MDVERWGSAVVAVGSGAVLGIARWLEPSPQGFGTHQQLGLYPCTFLAWTGHPCPMCGATTTFALMADFRPLDAVINQPFAALLAAMTLGAFGVSVAEAVLPRRRWSRISASLRDREAKLAGAFLGLMGLSWIWKLAGMWGLPA